VAYLAKVAKGDISLMPPSTAPALSGAGPVLFDAGSKVFGRGSCLS
jgi:phage gp36-like protein